ncbi:hypothetical protein H6P81_004921 [Aristolochia fimbriata]|uniref:Uncharacterized protein n=1 Tax=Aristolochia fimbriata TaxID=158543 RepID=A0AAV7ET42_ARIFI|nr:hypothetical protein H6P81_004921 [Aristolochia fimbriata]
MRVLFCKFQCPSFVCFCKSPVPIFSPCPLKLEDTQNVSSSLSPIPDSGNQLADEKVELEKEKDKDKEKEKDVLCREAGVLPKSSLRKPSGSDSSDSEVVKGRVQWMDFLGKELVEIKEFEPSESGDSDEDAEGHRGCVCVIQ